jgi:hypothetical protein
MTFYLQKFEAAGGCLVNVAIKYDMEFLYCAPDQGLAIHRQNHSVPAVSLGCHSDHCPELIHVGLWYNAGVGSAVGVGDGDYMIVRGEV